MVWNEEEEKNLIYLVIFRS